MDYTTKIPQSIYTKSRDTEPSPPMSPTYSAITENIANELNVLEKEDFKVNKKYLHDEFYAPYNKKKNMVF